MLADPVKQYVKDTKVSKLGESWGDTAFLKQHKRAHCIDNET